MTEKEAKSIGSCQGLMAVGLGLLIAQGIMTGFMSLDKNLWQAFFWFTTIDYGLNILVGAVLMLLGGHFFGQWAGKAILIRKRNFVVTGLGCGLGVLLTTAFFSGWTGFLQEGLDKMGTYDDPFYDYIYKPFFWITLFGLLPALVVGLLFGWRIKVKGKQRKATQFRALNND